MGMVAAARFSQARHMIKQKDVTRIRALLNDLHLPTTLDYNAQEIIRAVGKDKKKQGSDLFYVFLEQIGKARVEKISFTKMNDFITGLCKP